MIVARIYTAKGGPMGGRIIVGSSELLNWNWKEGWFPINNFDFGLKEKEQPDNDKSGGKSGGGNSGAKGSAARPSGGAPGSGSSSPTDKDKPSEMSLNKQVDYATTYLMKSAMDAKQSRKGIDDKNKLHADIHVLSSVEVAQKKNIFASLMIHLEGVQVMGWKINASGDDRPSETVTLMYDKAAMLYQWTPDGLYIQPSAQQGWDQTENKPWEDYQFDSKFLIDAG